jgi:hypothetical protein
VTEQPPTVTPANRERQIVPLPNAATVFHERIYGTLTEFPLSSMCVHAWH